MKASELQIGDWVYDTILKCNTQVEMLSLSGIRGDCHDNIWNEKTFEPIPLADEILEKNGFKQVGDDIWQLDVKSHWFWVDFNQYIFGCDLNTSTNEQENSFRILCISYNLQVHELQHALRLCGIEKEIVL